MPLKVKKKVQYNLIKHEIYRKWSHPSNNVGEALKKRLSTLRAFTEDQGLVPGTQKYLYLQL